MRISLPLLLAALLAFPASFAAAGEDSSDYSLEVADQPVPEEIADPIAELITPKVYRITGPDGLMYEFWFAKEIEMTEWSSIPFQLLDGIKPVSILGAAVVHGEERCWDFREDPIDPGAYTMRMGVQPQDGDHMGTAPTNTFAILVYADRDQKVEHFMDHEHMVDVSREGTIAEHPPILYMQNDEPNASEYPRLDQSGQGNRDWEVLCLKLPANVDGEKKELTFQLVFEGIGDI